MDRLQNFNSFSASRKKQVQLELEQAASAKRDFSAETYKNLLSEYGVTSLNELDEEQRDSFFSKLRGGEVNEDINYMIDLLEKENVEEGNAFGAARAKAIADGDKTFTVDGEEFDVESVDAEDKENAEDFSQDTSETAPAVSEAEVNSEEEFQEYAETILKNAFGEDYDESKAKEVIDGIIGKVDGDFGKAVGILQSSLG